MCESKIAVNQFQKIEMHIYDMAEAKIIEINQRNVAVRYFQPTINFFGLFNFN